MLDKPKRPLDAMDFNTEAHLKRNMALATPTDTARGMFFNGALEVVRKQGGNELVQHCREATGERNHVDFFNYPVESFLKLCLAAVEAVGPRLGGCEATLRWIGEQSAKDFLSSMAGKTMILLAGNQLTRILTQLPSGYRTAVSYGERSLVCSAQNSGRFVIQGDFMPPAYHEGILRGVMLTMQVRDFQIQGRATGPLDSEYEITWK